MNPIVKKLKTTNKFLSKIPVLPFLGMVFTLISVLIAIFMAYLALQQVNEIKIEKTHSDVSLGAEVLDEQSALGGIYNLALNPSIRESGKNIKSPTPPLYTLAFRIIRCESNFNQSAIGKAGEIGIAQFLPSTWVWMKNKSGLDVDINNANDQLRLLLWALQNGYANHWTCYKKLLTR